MIKKNKKIKIFQNRIKTFQNIYKHTNTEQRNRPQRKILSITIHRENTK